MNSRITMLELRKLVDEAKYDKLITCPKCHFFIKPNDKKCQCGWVNIISKFNFV